MNGTTERIRAMLLHEEWVRRGKPRDASGKPTLRQEQLRLEEVA